MAQASIQEPTERPGPPLRGLGFPLAMWAASRAVIGLVMLGIAPWVAAPPGGTAPELGWEVLAPWDGGWYLRIAAEGYDYAPDGRQHSIAFFPLYPLLIRAGIALGLPGAAAGTLISHLAMLGALCLLFGWVRDRHGPSAARWACAVAAWFPMALFGSLVYAEGLFLLLSIGALRAYEQGRYGWAAACGALAAATRVTGVVLAPAMAWAAWRERKPAAAWVAAGLTTVGLGAFCAYGAWRFGDPLAFLHAQQGWRAGLGFDAQGWWALWKSPATWGEAIPKTAIVFGAAALLWRLRSELGRLQTAYGLLAVALVVASGSTTSVDRYVYAIAPAAIALGLVLARHPRWGGAALFAMAVMLVSAALRIARGMWVA